MGSRKLPGRSRLQLPRHRRRTPISNRPPLTLPTLVLPPSSSRVRALLVQPWTLPASTSVRPRPPASPSPHPPATGLPRPTLPTLVDLVDLVDLALEASAPPSTRAPRPPSTRARAAPTLTRAPAAAPVPPPAICQIWLPWSWVSCALRSQTQ